MPRQSPRLGVNSISMAMSGKRRYSASGLPTGASSGNSIKPDASASMPSSLAEHNMPRDSTPRSFAVLMVTPFGNLAPTVASGATRPARALGAPHTICTSPVPVSTRHTRNLSASGCGVQAMMRATTTSSSESPMGATSPTSSPLIVSRRASAALSARMSTRERSQFSENFMDFGFVGRVTTRRSAHWNPEKFQSSFRGHPRFHRGWKPEPSDFGHRNEGAGFRVHFPDQAGKVPRNDARGFSSLRLRKLLKETYVVLEERPQVGDAVAQHCQPFDAHAEREAGVPLGVDAAVPQDVRMHHAAAQHLQPARAAVVAVPADIHLGRGLGEREIAWPETHLERLPEECGHEGFERSLQVRESGRIIHQ